MPCLLSDRAVADSREARNDKWLGHVRQEITWYSLIKDDIPLHGVIEDDGLNHSPKTVRGYLAV